MSNLKQRIEALREIITWLRVRPAAVLTLIVIFALAVRLFFYVGITYALDQDEGVYLNLGQNAANGNYRVNFNDKPADYMPDPAEAFQFRYPIIFAAAASFKLFGVNDGAAVLFSLLCSLGSVVLVYHVARLLMDVRGALAAAFLYAFFPLDVLFGTRLMPDGPMAFFFWLAVYWLMRADREPSAGWRPTWAREGLYIAAGVAVGMCYFIKLSTVFIAGVMGVYILLRWRFTWRYALVGVGFMLVLCGEGIYYVTHGDPFFLNLTMNTRVFEWKFANENPLKVEVVPGWYNFWLIDPTITWYYTREILISLNPFQPTFLGWFWGGSLVGLGVIGMRRDRRLYLAAVWFVVLYLMLEFMPVRLGFNEQGAWLNHYLVSQRMRYMTVAIVPAVLLCAYVLTLPGWRFARLALLIALAGTSFASMSYQRDWFQAGMRSLDAAGDFLKLMPKRVVYTDYMARNHLQYRLGKDSTPYIRDQDAFPEHPKDCLVIVGGSRGMDISHLMVEDYKKLFLAKKDPSWIELLVIPNPARNYYPESDDLTIYLVP